MLTLSHINVIKILFLMAFSSIVAVLWTPILTHFLYKYKCWRKSARETTIDGKEAKVFNQLHKQDETKTPRMGGLLIWATTTFVIFFFSALANVFDGFWFSKINFLSRDQTWLPLAILIASSFLGLIDDILQIVEKGKYKAGGMKFIRRLAIILIIGFAGGWWFYFKLGWHSLYIPLVGSVEIGFFYLPLFVLVVLATWAGGVIDGIDGLAGGVFAIMFSAFAIIAFSQAQYNLAAFCGVIAGTTLAFLWFNIPPARFYMGETGSIGLTATLASVAFLTNSVLILPIIGGLLVVEVLSNIIQLISKKFFNKKIFKCAPLHHHLEAIGWAPEKVTMRFWIISMILAIVGITIRLLG